MKSLFYLSLFLLLAMVLVLGCVTEPQYGIVKDKRVVSDKYGNDVYRMVYTLKDYSIKDVQVSPTVYYQYNISDYAPIEEYCGCGE